VYTLKLKMKENLKKTNRWFSLFIYLFIFMNPFYQIPRYSYQLASHQVLFEEFHLHHRSYSLVVEISSRLKKQKFKI
jgi:hypothetical protein